MMMGFSRNLQPLSNSPHAPQTFGLGNILGEAALSRRRVLQSAAAGMAVSVFGAASARAAERTEGAEIAAESKKRVGLIGAGWYGKSDLWRLIQVAPVEVVSICDPDQKMLDEAIQIAAQRQASKQRPRGYGDYRKMLA